MIDAYGNEIEWVPVIHEGKEPMYQKIANAIEEDIMSGRLLHGAKLPPQRVIANHLGLNHGTVTRAYKACEEKGLLKGTIGKGTFVSGSAGLPINLLISNEEEDGVNMAMAFTVYELNPYVEKMIKEVSSQIDYNSALKYCPPGGLLKHRYIAANWLKSYGMIADPYQILISSGTQNALAVILIGLFNKSDRIIVDEFTYTGLKSLAKYLGIILVPVKGDLNGMCVEDLENTCKRENIKGIYLMPDCHNPTSITLSDRKRREIAEVIKKCDLFLIEDGTYSYLEENRPTPISTYIPEQSFYIHGTSKAVSPALRISYLVAPKVYMNALEEALNNLTWMASPFTSEIMSLLQSTGRYEQIVDRKLDILRKRNKAFDAIFEGYDYIPSETSLFRYLYIPECFTGREMERLAAEEKVKVLDVNRFHAGVSDPSHAIRLSVSSPNSIEELTEGLKIIRKIMEGHQMKRIDPIV